MSALGRRQKPARKHAAGRFGYGLALAEMEARLLELRG
jgi:hypothetical protein